MSKNMKTTAPVGATTDTTAASTDSSLDELKALLAMSNTLCIQWMQSVERMATAAIAAEQAMLASVLKGAENIDEGKFTVMVNAQKEVAMASIAAEQAVALAGAENGKAFIKMLESLGSKSIEAAQPVLQARVAYLGTMDQARLSEAQAELIRAQTEAKQAETEERLADLREQELEVKRQNAKTERRKAEAAAYTNGIA